MTRTGRSAIGLVAVLALAACGGNADSDSSSTPQPTGSQPTPAAESAEIRLWINGSDTPEAAREWLTSAFEEANPGSTLTIEEQQWEGLVERLTTSLSSESETPDVVEVGNTQAATFTTVGAFADLTDQLDRFGGNDLLPGFVEAGSADGKTYALPYYAGSKFVFYRKDLFEQSGLTVPTTMEEFIDAAVTLKQDNPQPANFSGFWLPGQDWRNGVAFVWDAGGDLAVEEGGQWHGALSSPESVTGLETVQRLFQEASGAAKDGNEADPQVPFCAGEIGMLSAPGWLRGVMESPDSGCPDIMANVGVFALPGSSGEPAPVLLGGSNIAVSAKSQHPELAKSLVELMLSEDFQTIMAEAGLTPALESLAPLLGDDEYAEATIAAASNARLTPPAAAWASVEGSRVLEDLFVAIANGGDVAALASAADETITDSLGG